MISMEKIQILFWGGERPLFMSTFHLVLPQMKFWLGACLSYHKDQCKLTGLYIFIEKKFLSITAELESQKSCILPFQSHIFFWL